MTSEGFDAAAASAEACRQTLAARITSLLDRRGWKPAHLAEASGISRPEVSLYVRARRLPGDQKMEAIAAALECTEEDLLPGIKARREGGGPRPSQDLRIADAGGGMMDVEVRRRVPVSVAIQIAKLLGDENAVVEEKQ